MPKFSVIHKECGAQCAWWLGNKPMPGDVVKADNFVRMDGTHPKAGDMFHEICPSCGEQVYHMIISMIEEFKK